MSTRSLTIEHDGVTYSGRAGMIQSALLGYGDDHSDGIMSAYLTVEGPGWEVLVGGYALDQWDDAAERRIGTAYGLDQVIALLDVIGVDSWEKVKGERVFVLFEGDTLSMFTVRGLAHVIDEKKVFIFDEHAKTWREREGRAVIEEER